MTDDFGHHTVLDTINTSLPTITKYDIILHSIPWSLIVVLQGSSVLGITFVDGLTMGTLLNGLRYLQTEADVSLVDQLITEQQMTVLIL
jgi:hypothetical protein